jgi:hypothetical protein
MQGDAFAGDGGDDEGGDRPPPPPLKKPLAQKESGRDETRERKKGIEKAKSVGRAEATSGGEGQSRPAATQKGRKKTKGS